MDIVMYVISHKDFKKPKIACYKSLLVGADFNTVRLDITDNIGDNISFKNRNYCELTGLYWMWKNSSADILGLCHYRRYFTKSPVSNSEKYFLNEEDIKRMFEKYDIIVPKKRYYKEKVIQAINIAPNMDDVKEMEKAIATLTPEYLDAYHNYLNGNECYLYNMCIMKKNMLHKYCEWLFKILTFIENDYHVDNSDSYRSRLFGFLSERLIYVWIIKNIDKTKIKEVRVVKTDEGRAWLVAQDIKNRMRRVAYCIKGERN